MHKTRSAVYHYNTYHLGLEKLQLEFSQAHDSNIITLQNPLKTNLRFNSHLNTQAGRTSQECLHLFMSLEPRRYCDVTLMTGLLCWVVQYSWFWWSLSKDYVYDVSPPRGVGGCLAKSCALSLRTTHFTCVKPYGLTTSLANHGAPYPRRAIWLTTSLADHGVPSARNQVNHILSGPRSAVTFARRPMHYIITCPQYAT